VILNVSIVITADHLMLRDFGPVSDNTIIVIMMLRVVFNAYMNPCEISALKQKTVHSLMACYVHVFSYNAENRCLHVNVRRFCN
jgi:hypothetical protein